MKAKGSRKRQCPVKSSLECLDFQPVPTTPKTLNMSQEQMSFAGVTAIQRLYWCTECESVWYETEHHFAHIIGKLASTGSLFVPSESRTRNIYIGD